MHPELTHMINAQRNGEMRDQAAACRRAAEARGTARARPARIHSAAIAPSRTPQSVPGLKPLRRPAATCEYTTRGRIGTFELRPIWDGTAMAPAAARHVFDI